MKLLVSLHDVAPHHLPRLANAEALLQNCGVDKVNYLLIPDYHGRGRSDQNTKFVDWCCQPRAFRVDWLLHGYSHIDMPCADRIKLTWRRRLAERFLTAGESEFLRLTAPAQRELIEKGRVVFERCLGHQARGFVAPAWLFNDSLLEVLRESAFDYTESHGRIFSIADGLSVKSPVITWATRTTMRKRSSIAAAPILAWLWSREPLLRLALHPFDFDHPEVVASIRGLLAKLLAIRQTYLWSDSLANSAVL